MKVALIGVGQAGGKITEALAEFDYRMDFDAVHGALAVNSAKTDLEALSLDTMLVGQDKVKGHGVGGDNELGAEIMQNDLEEVMDGLDGRITAEAEAIFVVAGLGGGTGSGGAPVVTRRLQRIYDVPVYALAVLPGENEGSMYQVNAARSLKTLIREATTTIVIDNDAWHSSGESVEEAYDAINEAIARRIGLLLAAGEGVEGVGESVVDSSEIINTLRSGDVAALGYAKSEAAEESSENINLAMSLVRRAFFTGTSLPDATEIDSALVVAAGESERIPRKGFERGRKWMEDETGSLQVRGGDFPLESDNLAVLLLLGGVEKSDRLNDFLERAAKAQEEVEADEQDADDPFQNEELDDLF